MARLFEGSVDNNPNTANRIAFGRAGFAYLNMTLANFLIWLQSNLNFNPALIPSIEDLGDWNMNVSVAGDLELIVAHNITDYKKIRSITVVIRDDTDTITRYSLTGPGPAGVAPQGAIVSWTSTSVVLRILSGGFFDSTSFDSTGYNRGHMLIEAIP